jgi:O-antigen ligase
MTKPQHKSPPPDWPARLRRGLVILVTALVVARPLVLGEDPGQVDPISDATGHVLTLLWLVAAVGWAGWRLWHGQGVWHGGLVEAGLLAAAGAYFLSSGVAAAYRHPAWLIACEWLVLVVCLSLVRQLAGPADTRRGLLAAVLATAVSLAALGIYQGVFELPGQRRYAQNLETLRRDWEKQTGRPIRLDDPELANLAQRLQQDNVFATFANPNSFAGYLALLLPAAVGYAAVAWRQRTSTWQPVAAVVAAGALAVALFLTHSRGAALALVLVGAAVALWFGRGFLRRHLAWAAAALVLLAGAGVLVSRMTSEDTAKRAPAQSLGLRLNYWRATWGMVRDHPWLGVGPGNYSRYYPRYMVPTAVNEKISDPHNFVLDVWANAGVLALAGLFVALGAVAGRLAGVARDPTRVPREPPPPVGEETPWDFYLGGMAGLLLAYVLKASVAPDPDSILIAGVEAGGRSVVWFAAFALFWSIPWSGSSVVLALAAGVAACLLNLCVSGGISFPSVAQPLWTVAALALVLATAGAPGWVLRPGLALFLPLPLLAAAAFTYLLMVVLPTTACDYHLRQAHLYQNLSRQKASNPKTVPDVGRSLALATSQLQEAHRADPTNVTPLMALARWDIEVNPLPGRRGDVEALGLLEQARALDPMGKEVLLLTLQDRLRLAAQQGADRAGLLDAAAKDAAAVEAIDPSEAARLHVLLAEHYFAMGDQGAGYREAKAAWQADWEGRERGWPAYELTDTLRKRVRVWIDRFEAPWRLHVGPVLAGAPHGPLQVLPALYLKPEARRPRPLPAPAR